MHGICEGFLPERLSRGKPAISSPRVEASQRKRPPRIYRESPLQLNDCDLLIALVTVVYANPHRSCWLFTGDAITLIDWDFDIHVVISKRCNLLLAGTSNTLWVKGSTGNNVDVLIELLLHELRCILAQIVYCCVTMPHKTL